MFGVIAMNCMYSNISHLSKLYSLSVYNTNKEGNRLISVTELITYV